MGFINPNATQLVATAYSRLVGILALDDFHRKNKGVDIKFGDAGDGKLLTDMFAGFQSGKLPTLDPKLFKDRSRALSKLDNREFIKQALGIDIGGVANIMNRTDALRIAVLEKRLATTGFASNDAGTAARNANIFRAIGSSATAAFQVERRFDSRGNKLDTFSIDPRFKKEREARDAFANQGGFTALNIAFGIFGGRKVGALSRSGSSFFRDNFAPIVAGTRIERNAARALGSDEQARFELAELISRFEGTQSIREVKTALALSGSIVLGLANRNTATLSTLGLDVNIGGFTERRVKRLSFRSGNNLVYSYSTIRTRITADPRSILQQLIEDIGASQGIAIPSASKLIAITDSFNNNGMFTNFNNIAITNDAMVGLNLTEQNVFNIRFNSTRGDRELLNRLRFIENQEAVSSGTAPI